MNLMSEDDRYLVEKITKYLDDTEAKYTYDGFPDIVNGFIEYDTHNANTCSDEYFNNMYHLAYIALILRRRRDGKEGTRR